MQSLPKALKAQNFQQLSKVIQINKIEVSMVDKSMKRQIQKNRLTYAFPAKIEAAQIHRNAVKFSFKNNIQSNIPIVCPCCEIRIDGEPISICYGPTESSIQLQSNYQQFQLPAGIAVFLSFLKTAAFYLFILVAFTAYTLITSQKCQIPILISSFMSIDCTPLQIPTSQPSIRIEDILFLSSLVVIIVFFIIYRKKNNEWHRFLTAKNLSEESYTILVSNIPVLDFPKKGEKGGQFFYRKHLQEYLQEQVKNWAQSLQSENTQKYGNQKDYCELLQANHGALKLKDVIKSISLCCNLSRLTIIDQNRQRLIEQHQTIEDNSTQMAQQLAQNNNNDRFSSLPKRIDFINDCRLVLNKQFASDNSFLFNLTHFVGHAFISFQYQHYRNYFLDTFHSNPKAFLYNGSYLKISPASTPSEVNWKNLSYTVLQKKQRRLNTIVVLSLILSLQFLLLFAAHSLLYNKNSIIDAPFKEYPHVFLIFASCFIVVVNAIIKYVSKPLIINEKHKSKGNQISAYISFTVVAQFLSSGIMIFFINLLQGRQSQLPLYALYFIGISSILELMYQLIHPIWIKKQIGKWWRYRNKDTTEVSKFQFKLNHQFQLPPYQIQNRYAYFIYKAYIALFFAEPLPWGLPITFIFLVLMYWVDKLNLFKRSSIYYYGNLATSNVSLKLLQISLLIYAAAYFYFSSNSTNQINVKIVVGLILVFIYTFFILVAPVKLQSLVFGYVASGKFSYDDCVADGKFGQTYWNCNPATFLVAQSSVTGKKTVANPALMREFKLPESS